MNRKISLHHVLLMVAFCVTATFLLSASFFYYYVVPKREGDLFDINNKLIEIEKIVDEYYIGEYDKQDIADGLFLGYAFGLNDPYAGYITKEDSDESLNSLYGLNTGIGVQVTAHPDNNTMYVLEVHKGSPADQAGVLPGDEIFELDGQILANIGYSAALAYIPTVPIGQKIHTGIIRNGEKIYLDIELQVFESQSVFYRNVNGIGYVLVTGFSSGTFGQFTEACDKLKEQGVKGVVIDLRNNGGGLLNTAYHMIDYVIPAGLAIEVDYKGESRDETYLSGESEYDLPIAILTNDQTASASELFSQALLDYDKAITIGGYTYGKGVVQRTFTLSDGSLFRCTVAKYYTANGTCLDGIGVAPTIPTEWTDDELRYRLINGIEVDKDFLAAVDYFDQLS